MVKIHSLYAVYGQECFDMRNLIHASLLPAYTLSFSKIEVTLCIHSFIGKVHDRSHTSFLVSYQGKEAVRQIRGTHTKSTTTYDFGLKTYTMLGTRFDYVLVYTSIGIGLDDVELLSIRSGELVGTKSLLKRVR